MYETLEADVTIIGGGLAGLNAAIAAAERGARVVVMEKAKIERSGAIAGGVDHMMAYLNEGGDWDTEEGYLNFVKQAAYGIVDLKIHKRVLCDELSDALERLERVGCPLRDPETGTYYRTQSFGQPGPYWINFDGKDLKPKLAKEARRLGCQVLDFTMATKLFVQTGKLVGVSGLNVRDGSFAFVHTKALVAATGNTNRLFETPSGLPFNTWLCPYDTGTSQALAFDIGAVLANMEFLRMTIVPKGFSAPGLNAFTGMGARFINALGEPYMEQYHPLGDKAPRNVLVYAALMEVREGRGPLFLDCTHLPEEDVNHLKYTLSTDSETLADYLHQKEIDIAAEPLEVEVSEAMQTGPIEVVGAGIKIDENCMSNIPGLFAAGDCADQMKIVHMAIAGGYAAGKGATRYAEEAARTPYPEEAVLAEQERVDRITQRDQGLSHEEVEKVLRKIMTENVGPMRTEISLKNARRKLIKLKPKLSHLKAHNYHELMRCLEAQSLVTVGQIMTEAALARKESRQIPYHYRLDYPETNDEEWAGQILVWQENGAIQTAFHQMEYGE